MTRKLSYRFCLALVFLALYAFIALPVQWWHHHPGGRAMRAGVQCVAGKAGTGPQYATAAPADDCPVCAHQYSVYYQDVIPFRESIAQALSSHTGGPLLSLPGGCRTSLCNKGPPTC